MAFNAPAIQNWPNIFSKINHPQCGTVKDKNGYSPENKHGKFLITKIVEIETFS